jgi:hypothetical protein
MDELKLGNKTKRKGIEEEKNRKRDLPGRSPVTVAHRTGPLSPVGHTDLVCHWQVEPIGEGIVFHLLIGEAPRWHSPVAWPRQDACRRPRCL